MKIIGMSGRIGNQGRSIINKEEFEGLIRRTSPGNVICTVCIDGTAVDLVKDEGSFISDCTCCMLRGEDCFCIQYDNNLIPCDHTASGHYYRRHKEDVKAKETKYEKIDRLMSELSEYAKEHNVKVTLEYPSGYKITSPVIRWIQCTPENIQVGDEVRGNYSPDCAVAKVVHVHKKSKREICIEFSDGDFKIASIKDYEKKVTVSKGTGVDSSRLPQPIIKSFAEMKIGDRGVIVESEFHPHQVGVEVIKLSNDSIVGVNTTHYWSTGNSIKSIMVKITNN